MKSKIPAIKYEDIFSYICLLLESTNDVEKDIYQFTDSIALDVFENMKLLHENNSRKFVGILLNVVWKHGKKQGYKQFTDSFFEAIKKNKNLRG